MAKLAKRGRRSDKEIFESAVNVLLKKQQSFSVNALSSELDWEDSKVRFFLEAAQDEGWLTVGRGGGGGAIQRSKKMSPVRIFISYSHVDEEIKVKLTDHLKPYERAGLLDVWHDSKIGAGDHLEKTIFENLNKSDIAVFLVSIDFINSKFCYEKELQSAIKMQDENRLKIIPVVARQCNWLATPLSSLKAIPKDGAPLISFGDIDIGLTGVAKEISREAEIIRGINS